MTVTAPVREPGGRGTFLRPALLVFAVALVVRLAFIAGFLGAYDRYETITDAAPDVPVHAMIKSDAGGYFAEAVRIRAEVERTGSWIVDSAMGPFLYPRLIALYGRLGGSIGLEPDGRIPVGAVTGLLLFQAAFFAACLAVFYLALRRELPGSLPLVAALFLAVEPTNAQYAAALMTESVYFGLLMLAVAFWIRAAYPQGGAGQAGRAARWIGLGLLLGVLYLYKPISILLPAAFGIATLFVGAGRGVRGRLAAAAFLLGGYAVVLAALGAYNLAAGGIFSVLPGQARNDPMQYIATRVIALDRNPALSMGDLINAPAVKEIGVELSGRVAASIGPAQSGDPADIRAHERAFNQAAQALALDVFAEHPLLTAKVVGWHMARATGHLNPFHFHFIYSQIYKSTDPALQRAQWSYRLSLLPLIAAFSLLVLAPVLLGWLMAGRRLWPRRPAASAAPVPGAVHVLLTLLMLYHPFMGGWLGNDRYIIPNIVPYAVYWAIFMVGAAAWLRRRMGSRGA